MPLPLLSGRGSVSARRLRAIAENYEVRDRIRLRDGKVPLAWWTNATNFGDLLSPWLVGKMTGYDVVLADSEEPHYVAIGSIVRKVRAQSIAWGTGSFGVEPAGQLDRNGKYKAVRGPLTRSRLLHFKVRCPEVYGDPALLAPLYYFPDIKVTHDIGLVVRWSEPSWPEVEVGSGVKLISYGTDDVEGVIDAMLSCRRIISSSLHGLIVADAYGIPNAWLASRTPKGGEFKFHDYFASVRKHRYPQSYDMTNGPHTVRRLSDAFTFSAEPIVFDHRTLLDACPFMRRRRLASR
jgi:pyruvyltransferase